MGGRRQIKPDNIPELLDKLRVLGELELAHPVRLKAMAAPDAQHRTWRNSRRFGHGGGRPVRRLAGRGTLGQLNNACDGFLWQRRLARGARLVPQKPLNAFLHETLLPAPNAGLGFGDSPYDFDGPQAVMAEKNDPGPPDMFLRPVAVHNDRLQTSAILSGDIKRNSRAHPVGFAWFAPERNPNSDSYVRCDPLAFLIDECLTPDLAEIAQGRGFHALHVTWARLRSRKDPVISKYAVDHDMVLVTNNLIDFTKLYKRIGLHPGLILLAVDDKDLMDYDAQVLMFEHALEAVQQSEPVNEAILAKLIEDADQNQFLEISRYELYKTASGPKSAS